MLDMRNPLVLAHTEPAASYQDDRGSCLKMLHHACADAELPADLEDAITAGPQL
jgi:hypothetical protein